MSLTGLLEPMLLHFQVQRRPRQAQEPGGMGLVALGVPQGLDNQRLLHLLHERFVRPSPR